MWNETANVNSAFRIPHSALRVLPFRKQRTNKRAQQRSPRGTEGCADQRTANRAGLAVDRTVTVREVIESDGECHTPAHTAHDRSGLGPRAPGGRAAVGRGAKLHQRYARRPSLSPRHGWEDDHKAKPECADEPNWHK